jgi:hypothetical protein
MANKKVIDWNDLKLFMDLMDLLPGCEYEVMDQEHQDRTYEFLKVTRYQGEDLSEPLPRVYKKKKPRKFTVAVNCLDIYNLTMYPEKHVVPITKFFNHDLPDQLDKMTDAQVLNLIREIIGPDLTERMDGAIRRARNEFFVSRRCRRDSVEPAPKVELSVKPIPPEYHGQFGGRKSIFQRLAGFFR